MAEEVTGHCRDYVAEHAASFNDLSEDEAVPALVAGVLQQLREMGWDKAEAAYQIDVENLVRECLRKHRGE